jgi:hypothetical protein
MHPKHPCAHAAARLFNNHAAAAAPAPALLPLTSAACGMPAVEPLLLHTCLLTGACYVYGRSFNPTSRYLGRQMAALEGTEAGYVTSSGGRPGSPGPGHRAAAPGSMMSLSKP